MSNPQIHQHSNPSKFNTDKFLLPSGSSIRGDRESGQALFAILVLIIAAAIGLVFGFFRPTALAIENDNKTTQALAQAKDALIGRAAKDSSIPGSLPCPDAVTNIPGINVPNDGIADLFAGSNCPSYIGRLPWRTLGLPDLRDSSGERLWYALSPNFRDHPTAQPVNSDTTGQLTVTGMNPANNVIAIVFAPGPVLGTQVRDSANQNNPANYLEGGNENGGATSTYVTGANTDTFNDRLLIITSDDLFRVVELRVAREIRTALRAYFTAVQYYPFANDYSDSSFNCTPATTRGRLPLSIPITCPGLVDWPAPPLPFSLPPWFALNNWHLLTYYTLAPACTNTTPNCTGAGLITVKKPPAPANTNVQALVIAGGRALPGLGQPNPCGSVANCLESIDSSNPPDGYLNNLMSGTFNDKIIIVGP